MMPLVEKDSQMPEWLDATDPMRGRDEIETGEITLIF